MTPRRIAAQDRRWQATRPGMAHRGAQWRVDARRPSWRDRAEALLLLAVVLAAGVDAVRW